MIFSTVPDMVAVGFSVMNSFEMQTIGHKIEELVSDGEGGGRGKQAADVTFLVNRFTFLVGAQIGLQIYWLAANCARYQWEGAAFHSVSPEVTNKVAQKRNVKLSNTEHMARIRSPSAIQA